MLLPPLVPTKRRNEDGCKRTGFVSSSFVCPVNALSQITAVVYTPTIHLSEPSVFLPSIPPLPGRVRLVRHPPLTHVPGRYLRSPPVPHPLPLGEHGEQRKRIYLFSFADTANSSKPPGRKNMEVVELRLLALLFSRECMICTTNAGSWAHMLQSSGIFCTVRSGVCPLRVPKSPVRVEACPDCDLGCRLNRQS